MVCARPPPTPARRLAVPCRPSRPVVQSLRHTLRAAATDGASNADQPPASRSTRPPQPVGAASGPTADATPAINTTPPPALRTAAAAWEEAVKAGIDPDDAVAAIAFGVPDASALSDTQAKYAKAVAAKLADAAAAEKAATAAKAAAFEAGKRLYAAGEYRRAVDALQVALDAEGPMSNLGGDIQLWKALAHQAAGQEEECLAVYRSLEAGHPSPRVRKQAADLRFIMEAPKLRVGRDERVELPELAPPERPAGERGGRRRGPPPPPPGGRPVTKPRRPKTWEERWAEEWKPPVLLANRYVRVAAVVVGVAAAVYSAVVSRSGGGM